VRRGLVGVLAATFVLAPPTQVIATPAPQICCKRQVILLLMEEISYEDALNSSAPIGTLGLGGIGLTTAANDNELSGLDGYRALGAGGDERGAMARALTNAKIGLPAVVGFSSDVQGTTRMGVSSALLGSGPLRALLPFGAPEDLVREVALLIIPGGGGVSSGDFAPLVASSPAEELMLVVAVPVTSSAMQARGDEVAPLMIARGQPDELARTCVPVLGCAQGLTSATTRRDGIVSNVDVAPTILDFLGVPIPEEMTGSPIRIEGEPPTRLHQRYLQYQRIHTPIGLLALAVAILTILVSLGVLLARWPAPGSLVRALGILALVSVALPVVMLPVSLLPRLTYSLVLPTLAGAAALVTIVALLFGRHDSAAPVAIVAGLGMGVVVLDGILGWPAMMMPLLGDSALEGVRFYGMGNAFAGVYMAGAILLAARIPPVNGMALLVVAGLLAGLPGFGAELGTSFTLFAAAGLWYMFRVRRRFGLREVATAGAVTIVGLATILVIHRFSSVPTHVTRVVQDAPGDILSVFGRRLALNFRTTNAIPSNWLIVALLPVGLAVAWKRLGPFGSMLRRDAAWRDAAVVLALSSIIGYLVNDTIGVAGLGVTYLSAALIYPTLRKRWTSG
jgi:hypothetical protein